MMEQGKLGRPVLIGIQTLVDTRHRLSRYRDTMLESGFSRQAVDDALDQTWCQRALFVSDSDEHAAEVGQAALVRYRRHLDDARREFNPGGLPLRDPSLPPVAADILEHAYLAGTPETVAGGIEELRDAGVRNLLLNVNVGQIPADQVESSMRLFGENVIPKFR